MDLLKKPRLAQKMYKFYRDVRKNDGHIGTKLRVLEMVYSNACNFNCQHCSTRAPLGENAEKLMSVDKVASLADEADSLDLLEWHFHGGELLTNKDRLFELIRAVKPERFYCFLTSNGYLFTQEIADELATAGIDRVSISIDSFDAKIHDGFRGVPGAYDRAMAALEYVKKAGMDAFMNITVGHYNAFSEDVENLCKYSADHGYRTLINIAIPCGKWQGKLDVVIDDKDKKRLIELRKKYGNVYRDIWNPTDKNNEAIYGCQTMNKLYMTPAGDIFPCSFLHISVGNVYKQSLKEIVEYGQSIKYFHDHSDTCLAGENLDFIKKFMVNKPMTVMNPLDAREVFFKEDYL